MKYKMFVCDLDGTLLDDNHQISKENLEAIKNLQSQGIKFIIATGRSKYMVQNYLELLDYNMPLIWCNGAVISSPENKRFYEKIIQTGTVRRIIELAKKYNIDYVVYTLGGIVGEAKSERIKWIGEYNKGVKDEHKAPIIIHQSLYANVEKYEIVKVFISSRDRRNLHKFRDTINNEINEVQVVFSQSNILDITHKEATKGNAVLDLAQQLNILPQEIAAIGDNYNDISMLKVCGLPLTLENAEDNVKKIATYITKDNNSSGVAYAIENFIR